MRFGGRPLSGEKMPVVDRPSARAQLSPEIKKVRDATAHIQRIRGAKKIKRRLFV
jgi:hypothetical protein